MTLALSLWAIGSLLILGAIIGSFLTVVISRVPEGRSIVRPRSACPTCGASLRWFDNVPIASYLVLRGRCRGCGTRIPIRYLLVELGTAAAYALLGAAAIAQIFPVALLPGFLIIASAGIALAVIDLEHHRLPNPIVATTYGLWGVATAIALVLAPETRQWFGVVVGGLLWFVVFGTAWWVTRGRGMGLGDVKLAPMLGASLGLLGVVESAFGLLLTFILGAAVGASLLLLRRHGRRQAIAFGPFMVAGWFTSVLIGSAIASWYLSVALGRYPS